MNIIINNYNKQEVLNRRSSSAYPLQCHFGLVFVEAHGFVRALLHHSFNEPQQVFLVHTGGRVHVGVHLVARWRITG